MTDTRDFLLADVLSVTTGKLLSNRRMEGFCDLIVWLTHEAPFPRFLDETTRRRLLTAAAKTRDMLIWQHPWLIDTQPPTGIDNSELLDWLLAVEARRGDVLTVVREDAFTGLVAAVDSARQALIELASALGRELPDEEGDDDA